MSGAIDQFVRCGRARRVVTLPFIAALLVSATSAAERDVVYLSAQPGSTAQTSVAGEVLDYTGEELTIRLPSGQEQRYPTSRIARVETPRLPEHQLALRLIDKHDYQSALAQLDEAYKLEERRWMRREILAQRVQCRTELGQLALAGAEFLVLVRSDPATQHFASIPLSWRPQTPAVDLENRARAWLQQRDSPVAVLLGASHLISLGHGGEVLDALRGLTLQADPRIAALAAAQTWRLRAAAATDRELEQWDAQIESMPPEVRGGPYYLLGQAFAQRQDWQRSALLLLRVALLYPYPRALAARSLADAASALERLGQADEAARLREELVRDYPDSLEATELRRQGDLPAGNSSDGIN